MSAAGGSHDTCVIDQYVDLLAMNLSLHIL